MPVGQESPTRGMRVWAVAVIADSKIKQSRYLVMGILLGTASVVYESEKYWGGTVRLGVANRWRAEPGGR